MSEKLSADLNIIQSAPIELELLDGDLNIIQKLDDEPNDVGGLTSAELKAKFDESGNIIKTYINETLIPAVLAEDATEESRKQAEAARVAAEQVRQSNEAARQNAESQRVSAENARNVWEDYSASKAYAVGNKVAYGGSSYLCIKPCTGIAPPNAEYWRLIAAKGAKGAKGDTGAQGAQGPQGAIGPEGPMGGSSNFVRYDLAQSLTTAQQAQARGNIAAANKETQDKVMATAMSTVSVTLSPAELPDYIAALPRLLAENLEITVTGGSVSTLLRINGFYGGRLMIKAADGAVVTCTKGIWVNQCDAIVVLYKLNVSGSAAYNNELVRVDWSPRVFLYQLSVNGNGTEIGVRSDFMCMTHMSECSLVNLGIGVMSTDTSQVGLEKCTGSGNTTGIYTNYGGMVLLDSDTPELLGGSANAKGGPIFKGGTLL